MKTREWVKSDKNLIYEPIDKLAAGLTDQERANLELVITELIGWAEQDVDKVLSVMAPDGVYYDITLEPAVGHEGIRKFGLGWTEAVPDFTPYIEDFIVQGNKVADLGRIRGTITKEFFGMPATGKSFDAPFFQYCLIEGGKIKYVRDHWNAVEMYNQVGWDLASLKR